MNEITKILNDWKCRRINQHKITRKVIGGMKEKEIEDKDTRVEKNQINIKKIETIRKSIKEEGKKQVLIPMTQISKFMQKNNLQWNIL